MEVLNISKKYKEKYVLTNLSYNFVKGNLYWIKGINGSGKSTFIRCLLGIEEIDEGYIKNNNKNILYIPEIEITEDWLTIKENIELIYKFSNISIDDNENLYKSLNIKDNDIDNISKNCSTGTNMKVGFSLIYKGKYWDLIIIDEALAHIDIKTQKSIFRELIKKSNEGCTIIFTNHENIPKEFNEEVTILNLKGDNIYELCEKENSF